MQEEKLWHIFKHFDTNNHGYIESNDIKDVMAREGRRVPDEEISNIIKEVD